MVAVDTSALSAFFNGQTGPDVTLLVRHFAARDVSLPPVVLTEVLSQAGLTADQRSLFLNLPLLDPTDGYWRRAGEARSRVLSHGLKARTADALIAQSCIDHDVALITRDKDFRHFAKHCGLKLA
jgi:predicted nucleic acid-binding protein